MWFIQPKQDFIAEIPWRYTNENAVMSWQVRARNYDISKSSLELMVFVIMASGGGYVMSLFVESLLASFLLGFGMFLPFFLLGLSVTHYTTIFVYRFTETLVEVHSWKPQDAAASAFLKWSAIILLPVVGVLALFEPALIVAGIGPLGIGLMALTAGSRQTKQDSRKHHSFYWQDTNKIYLYPDRNIIGLNTPWYHPEKRTIIPNGMNAIYCKEGERQEVFRFFKERLPDVDVVEEKFHL
ncbi:hypothetical protein [Vreelandella sp. GE22]